MKFFFFLLLKSRSRDDIKKQWGEDHVQTQSRGIYTYALHASTFQFQPSVREKKNETESPR